MGVFLSSWLGLVSALRGGEVRAAVGLVEEEEEKEEAAGVAELGLVRFARGWGFVVWKWMLRLAAGFVAARRSLLRRLWPWGSRAGGGGGGGESGLGDVVGDASAPGRGVLLKKSKSEASLKRSGLSASALDISGDWSGRAAASDPSDCGFCSWTSSVLARSSTIIAAWEIVERLWRSWMYGSASFSSSSSSTLSPSVMYCRSSWALILCRVCTAC